MLVKERSKADSFNTEALLNTLKAFRKGDFSVRMSGKRGGIAGEVASTLNDIIDMNQRLTEELMRLSRVVGKEGRIGQRAAIGPVMGGWGIAIDSVNSLVSDLVQPTAEVTRVIGAVARGDLSQTIPLETDGRPVKGELLRTAKIV